MPSMHAIDPSKPILARIIDVMASYIETQIAERRKALADLDRRRTVLEAELRAYEDVLTHELAQQTAQHERVNGADRADGADDDEGQTIRAAFDRLSGDWQKVVRTLILRQTFRANEMYDVGMKQGMAVTMPNVRSQLTLLTARGILRRVAAGEYAVADELREKDVG